MGRVGQDIAGMAPRTVRFLSRAFAGMAPRVVDFPWPASAAPGDTPAFAYGYTPDAKLEWLDEPAR